MRLFVERGILAQRTIDLREVVGHQRAVVRYGTTRVDKRQQQRFAAVVANVNLTIVLVAERKIRNFITFTREQCGGRRRAVTTDVRNNQIFEPGVRAIDNERRGEFIVRGPVSYT